MKRGFLVPAALLCLGVFFGLSGCDFFGSSDFAWHEIGEDGEPQFENTWVNNSMAYETAAYGIDGNGFVHLKGYVQDPSYNAYDIIFTLPEGHRPARTLLISAYAPSGTDDSGAVYLYNDGGVGLVDAGVTTGNSTSVSLDGITFFAEQ